MSDPVNLSSLIKSRFKKEDISLFETAARLAGSQKQRVVLVGGIVRDLLLDKPLKDIDIMVDHPADAFVQKLSKELDGQYVSHKRFLTFTIKMAGGEKIDVVTAREETYANPTKLPDVVPSTIEKDLKRRDFSINAMACWLTRSRFGEMLDPFSGEKDLKAGNIRVLHDKSFEDDPTRIFRAARFAARLNFSLENMTRDLLQEALQKQWPHQLSPVRRRHEFELILKEKNPLPALRLLQDWGALSSLHRDWSLLPEHESGFRKSGEENQPVDPVKRLVAWFSPWGSGRTASMMADLSFERAVKKDVLSHL